MTKPAKQQWKTARRPDTFEPKFSKESGQIVHILWFDKGGWQIAPLLCLKSGNARRELEKKSGRKVVTNKNYLALTQAAKKTKRIK
jgi:hypothetical protein